MGDLEELTAAAARAEAGGPWPTLVVDPPWLYGDAGIRGGTKKHYAGVPLELLLKMPVSGLAAPLAHLYLWTTNSFLLDGAAAALCKAWDFRPVQLLTWCKKRIGTGHHFRNTTEHVVFAIRGDGKIRGSASLPTHYYWPLSEHSEKPPELYREVVEKMSDGPYLDIFAREKKPGWDAWGDQVRGGARIASLDAWSAEVKAAP